MFLPKLTETKKSRDFQIEFRGLNHNYYVDEREFYDMENLSSTYYPVMAQREKRKISKDISGVTAMTAAENRLAWVQGTDFYWNGMKYGEVTEGKKQLVNMGAYICIFPDNKVFNTHSLVFEDMAAEYVTTDDVHYTLCTGDGDDLSVTAVSGTAPEDPENMAYWIDTGTVPHTLKQYSEVSGMWVSVPTAYTKIASNGIGTRFGEYDGVTISGSNVLNGDYVLHKVTDHAIVVIHLLEQVQTQAEPVSVERKIPQMDYVCELNNRLWGCSSEKHEIYACKLGDPKNWNSFAGLSTDSYAVTVGSDGDFTGCISHMGYVLFFKDDIIHKIYGTKPSNFQLTDVRARGVQKGSEGSLSVVNETLYYKSQSGICAYDGGLPAEISKPLGVRGFFEASGGALLDKYYVSMQDENGDSHLFTYDESVRMWHREDSLKAECFVTAAGELYCISDGRIVSIRGTEAMPIENAWDDEDEVEWFAETGEIAYAYPDRRYLSRLQIRAELFAGSNFCVAVSYDHGNWTEVFCKTSTSRETHLIPIKPRRCDTMRVRISGKGGFRLFAFGKTLEMGSDL